MSSSYWPTPFVVLVQSVRMAAFLVAYLVSSLRQVSESLHVD